MNIVEKIERVYYKYINFVGGVCCRFNYSTYGKRNRELKNKYIGKRCFILGNGSSLKEQDLSLLREEIVFCVNNFWRSELYDIVLPDYYLMFDPFFFDMKDASSVENLSQLSQFMSQRKKPHFILPFGMKEVIEKNARWICEETKVFYVENRLILTDDYLREYDMSRASVGTWSVIQYGILCAMYMGFEEIYLCGCEQTDIISSLKAYLDEDIEGYCYNINNQLQKKTKEVYTKVLIEDCLKGYVKIFHLYNVVYKMCEKQGIKLRNCSPVTLIDCIPKVDYIDLFCKSSVDEK